MRVAADLCLLGLAAALAVGCRDDDPDPVRPAEVCQELGTTVTGTTITVSAGSWPTISWSPRCRVSYLIVLRETESGSGFNYMMWAVTSRFERDGVGEPNTILPGVIYGVVPDGAVQLATFQPLTAGTQYLVLLWASELRAPEDGLPPSLVYDVASQHFFVR